MARKSRRHTLLALPSRQIAARAGRAVLVVSLLVLLMLGRNGNSAVMALSASLRDALVPALGVVSAPLDALYSISGGIRDWSSVYHQNRTLSTENRELLKWQALAKDMQVENDKLRRLLSVAPRRDSHFVTASIMSDHGSSFSNAALIDAGTEDGIAANQAAISERGLVGRVTEAGRHSARLLLLTDMNSRIPVMNERTREKMILIGKSGEPPVLGYVATNTVSKKGDRLITSGDGGVFPKNIPVGQIRSSDRANMQVDLFANIADIEYVSVVQSGR